MKGRNRRGAPPPPPKKNAPQKNAPLPRAVADAVRGRLSSAVAHHQQGRTAEAEAAYRAVLATLPQQTDALNLLGVLCLQTGRAAEAAELLTAAVQADGGIPDHHDNLGSALAALGRFDAAAAAHLRALRLKPDFAAARFNLANALSGGGRPDAAAAALRTAVALKPDYLKAWFNLGNAHAAGRRHRQAADAFARAAALAPDMVEAHINLSDSLSAVGDFNGALAHQRRAAALRPDDADIRYNIGVVLQQSARYEQAELAYREALRRRPDHYGAWNNLGGVLRRLRRPEQAAACHRLALVFRPDFLEAYYNLGNALQRLGRLRDAADIYERVLARNPDLATATHNLGMLSLIHGDLPRGWEGYEKRFSAREAQPDRRPPLPRRRDEPLRGRRLLVWREQGVGDEIMFSSCYPDLAAADGPVTVETDPRLVTLFARSFPTLTVRPQSCDAEGREILTDLGADLHCPAGSLPRLLRRRWADFPAAPQWLKPDPVRVARWRSRIGALGRGIKVGICWRSGLSGDERDAAYTALADWGPLFRLNGVRFINLQYDDCAAEIADAEANFDCKLHRWADLDLKNDFEATAALIANLDLVVTVGTSVGELAAALGTPTWRFGGAGDWSALGTACRPWHPAMRLWRAAPGEALPQVLQRIAAGLARLQPAGDGGARAADDVPTSDDLLKRALNAHRDGRGAAADATYRRLVSYDPAHADGLHLLGLLRHQSGDNAASAALIRRALRADPDFPFAANNLGLVLQAMRRGDAAERAFVRALTQRPDFAEALSHQGLCLQYAGRSDAAIRLHRRALRLAPDNAGFRTNLGAALERADHFNDAYAAYRRAAALDPGGSPDLLNNLGMTAQRAGRTGDADVWISRALTVDPRFALAGWNLGLLALERGDLATGWTGYERRFHACALQPPRDVRLPQWRGEPLAGRRLLLWDEQGIGDEILFAGCLDALVQVDGQVVVECDRRLVPLFMRAFPQAEVRASEGAPGGPERRNPSDCHLHLPIGSLPALLRRRLTDFPAARPAYLAPAPEKATLWRARLDALPPGLRVGIAWTSQVVDAYRRPAYTRLDDWTPLLETPGVVAVNLQYGDCGAELRRLEAARDVRLHAWDDLDLKDDFESVAALISALDLVVCPASSVGELAGALGTPIWRLCSQDWTQLGTALRPWFPSMRVLSPRPGESVADLPGRVARLLRRTGDAAGQTAGEIG